MEHTDTSGDGRTNGVNIHHDFRGDNKITVHNMSHWLSEDARGMFQRMIDDMYETLFYFLCSGIPESCPQTVINTQAGIYFGADSISAGLADEVRILSLRLMPLQQSTNNLNEPLP